MTGTNSNPHLLPAPLHSLRTLIVDDDEFMLEVVEETLHSFGIVSVARATSGQAALKAIDSAEQQVELILCDLNMENIDGIEFLRHLAERHYQGAILVLSASDTRILHSVNALASERDLRFLGSLRKPLEVSELYAILLKFGRSRSLAREQGKQGAGEGLLTSEQLDEGMRAGRAQVAFQPIFSVKRRRVIGAECLLRWRDPERGTLSPEPVVQAAEDHGLIVRLTEVVLEQALRALTEWSRSSEGLSVSVNLSSKSLSALELPESLSSLVRAAGIEPHRVILEVTESGLFADVAASLEVINRLALKGFRLAIDDFGVGHSNMQKLNEMPFALLKVDKSFVQGAREQAVARAIVESSVSLAHNLDMQVVAEGTETQQDLEFVIRAGCDKIQGHAIAKPMPADAFIPWMAIWDAGHAAGSSTYLHR